MQTLIPLLLMATVVFGAFAIMPFLNDFLGPRKEKESGLKEKAFECGNLSSGFIEKRRHIGFYLIAIDFVLFDVELAFLYPYAVQFGQLGREAHLFLMVFLGILTVGFIYAWKSGSLELN